MDKMDWPTVRLIWGQMAPRDRVALVTNIHDGACRVRLTSLGLVAYGHLTERGQEIKTILENLDL